MLARDRLYALRALRRNPRFTIAAVLTIALGIGANTAIFSFIDTIDLRPLPYPNPGRLVTLWETAPQGKSKTPRTIPSPASYFTWRQDQSLFTAVGTWHWDVVALSGGPWPERIEVQRISERRPPRRCLDPLKLEPRRPPRSHGRAPRTIAAAPALTINPWTLP